MPADSSLDLQPNLRDGCRRCSPSATPGFCRWMRRQPPSHRRRRRWASCRRSSIPAPHGQPPRAWPGPGTRVRCIRATGRQAQECAHPRPRSGYRSSHPLVGKPPPPVGFPVFMSMVSNNLGPRAASNPSAAKCIVLSVGSRGGATSQRSIPFTMSYWPRAVISERNSLARIPW